jgi:hypothetical protein
LWERRNLPFIEIVPSMIVHNSGTKNAAKEGLSFFVMEDQLNT